MTEARFLEVLKQVGAWQKGHFVFASWRHAPDHLDADLAIADLAPAIANKLGTENNLHVVTGPANGGNRLAGQVVLLLRSRGKDVVHAPTVKLPDGTFRFPDGIERLVTSKAIWAVVDDTGTTGKSVNLVIDLARQFGVVVAVAVMVNRGGLSGETFCRNQFIPRFHALTTLDLPSYDVQAGEVCPLCAAHVPIDETRGNGAAYVAEHGQP